MFHHPSPLFPDPFLVSDFERAFEDVVSMIAEAQNLEAQLEVNAFDPALADIHGEAEALWSATASQLAAKSVASCAMRHNHVVLDGIFLDLQPTLKPDIGTIATRADKCRTFLLEI